MIILQDILFNQVLKDNLNTEELMDVLIKEYKEISDLLDEIEKIDNELDELFKI